MRASRPINDLETNLRQVFFVLLVVRPLLRQSRSPAYVSRGCRGHVEAVLRLLDGSRQVPQPEPLRVFPVESNNNRDRRQVEALFVVRRKAQIDSGDLQ